MPDAIASAPSVPGSTRRHPPGLWTLAATEVWDRASYYGMQALLVLYMTQYLLLPANADGVIGLPALQSAIAAARGALSIEGQATQIFALYITALSLLPLLGGWLGDRFITRRTGVVSGAALMSAGHLSLGFDATFLLGLLLLVTGAGLLRGNIAPQIRALYAAEDPRTAEAFQIYYLTIAFGGFISPLVVGLVNERHGFHPAFAIAAAGMLIGLVWYVARMKTLPPDPPRAVRGAAATPLTAPERRNLLVLVAFLIVPTSFWIAQAQVWNVYNLWVNAYVDRQVGGFTVPVPWFQSLDSLAPMAMALGALFYARRRTSGPRLLGWMGAGCLFFGLGMLALSAGSAASGAGPVPIAVPLTFHLVSNLGWVLFAPTCATFYADYAPERWRGTMLGLNQLTVALAGFLSGPLSSIYESRGPAFFWGAIACVPIAGGALLLLAGPAIKRRLAAPADPYST